MTKMVKLVFVAALVLSLLTASVALAGTNYDPCDYEHQSDLVERIPIGQAPYYYTVSSCQYSSSSHQHYKFRSQVDCVYVCRNCGYTQVVPVYYYGDDVFCTLHDVGR